MIDFISKEEFLKAGLDFTDLFDPILSLHRKDYQRLSS